MRAVLATRNRGKIREVRQILGGNQKIQLVTLEDLGVPPSPDEDAVEAYETFRETALAKALYFARLTNLPAIADDSGLSVDALDGAPGVRSKRFSGRTDLSGAELDQANNDLLLERLADVPLEQRTAHFTCAVGVAFPDRPILATIGTCSGLIATEPRGTSGFGYDPLFLLPAFGVTFSEVAPEVKNRLSHRARAFRTLSAHLTDFLIRG